MLIVLIHGLAASKRFFAGLEQELQKIPGITTHSFDLLGFGRNKYRGSSYSLEEHLGFITSEIKSNRQNGEELVLLGHSMGGILALAWAANNPGETSKVILLNTPIAESPKKLEEAFRGEKQGWAYFLIAHNKFARVACEILCQRKGMRLLKPWKRRYMTDAVFEDYTEHTFKSVDRTFRNVMLEVNSAELMRKMTHLPILQILGTEDIATVRNSPVLPNIIRKEIPGGHHLPLQDPSAVFKAIEVFLKETPA